MKKIFVVLIETMIILCILFSFNVSYAKASTLSDVIKGGDNFVNSSKNSNDGINENRLKDTSNTLFRILSSLGMIMAVVISGVLGIQFMMASVEEKAKIKEQLIPFVIGCIVIFGAFSIWKIVIDVGNRL